MKLPALSEEPKSQRVSQSVIRAMLAIVLTILLVSIYANVQKLRRGKIETVNFAPATAPAVTP